MYRPPAACHCSYMKQCDVYSTMPQLRQGAHCTAHATSLRSDAEFPRTGAVSCCVKSAECHWHIRYSSSRAFGALLMTRLSFWVQTMHWSSTSCSKGVRLAQRTRRRRQPCSPTCHRKHRNMVIRILKIGRYSADFYIWSYKKGRERTRIPNIFCV